MKLTKEQYDKLNSLLEYIIKYDKYFDTDYFDEEIYSSEKIEESIEEQEEREEVYIPFPAEDDSSIATEELLELDDDIRSIKIEDHGHINTKYRSIYIVSANDQYSEFALNEYPSITIEHDQNVKINLINSSVIIGLVATKIGAYDGDYWPTYSAYTAIEFVYKDEKSKLRGNEELRLIDSFVFEVADTTNIALTRSKIYCPMDDYSDIEDEIGKIGELRELVPANDGMRYFRSGVQIEDSELKFLSFYKVLEHFSPIALRIEAYELMRKKLDASKSSFDSGDYIKSLFDLAKSVQGRFTDEELIKSSFSKCFDFVGLFPKLPASIQVSIKKQLKLKVIDYSVDPQKITTASNIAAKIIYKTRNNVVHAKSNFDKSGDEISSEAEFVELNAFMKEACSQSIRWYSRLPEHQKIEII
ncbi:hypothetical protein [Pseudoalteromonas sp. S1609]|uniref:hypothetical protein n=1 Tax=Pseudoalteromonas sp. S1609 TaxID=579505 RepID=UPI00110BED73|nr:hypothetical protein [Pseudoalteromonas sp. S1609]